MPALFVEIGIALANATSSVYLNSRASVFERVSIEKSWEHMENSKCSQGLFTCLLPFFNIFYHFSNVVIVFSQHTPKYWGWQQSPFSIHSGLLTYRDNYVFKYIIAQAQKESWNTGNSRDSNGTAVSELAIPKDKGVIILSEY